MLTRIWRALLLRELSSFGGFRVRLLVRICVRVSPLFSVRTVTKSRFSRFHIFLKIFFARTSFRHFSSLQFLRARYPDRENYRCVCMISPCPKSFIIKTFCVFQSEILDLKRCSIYRQIRLLTITIKINMHDL